MISMVFSMPVKLLGILNKAQTKFKSVLMFLKVVRKYKWTSKWS